MKTFLVLSIVLVLYTSCNNANETNAETNDSLTTANVSLPYTLKEKPSWEWGDENNAAIAMNALRGFETGQLDQTRQYFGDSVEFRGDYWHFKGTTDSLLAQLKDVRSGFSTYNVRMEDYESVRSKNNKDEYVSLWYHEEFTDNKGKVDSVFVMDDFKFVDGKIVSIDSKVRHYPTSKQQK